MRKRIAKANKELHKLSVDNLQKELREVMSGFENRGLGDLDALEWFVDRKLYEIGKRMESLRLNHPNQVGASSS